MIIHKRFILLVSRYSDLYTMLPPDVKTDQYCYKLLGDLRRISEYMFSVGPKKMSRRKMIQVLSTLRPWELKCPPVSSAVQVYSLCILADITCQNLSF